MNKSESIKELATALCQFQSMISTVSKNREVTVTMKSGAKYTFPYADFGAIREAIKEPLKECGLSFVQPISNEGVTTILMHSSGEYIESTIPLNQNQRPQELGSEITYKKRYSLSAILGLSTDDDDDGNWASGNEIRSPTNKADIKWYNQPDFDKDFQDMKEAIGNGVPPEEIISTIEGNGFKMSNEMKQKIKSI